MHFSALALCLLCECAIWQPSSAFIRRADQFSIAEAVSGRSCSQSLASSTTITAAHTPALPPRKVPRSRAAACTQDNLNCFIHVSVMLYMFFEQARDV